MVVHISSDISKWENTPLDITVRAGDELVIPKEPDFVLVSGQVYNSTALTYVPGKNAEWYLKRAGGASDSANKKRIYVIRADGSVIGSSSGVWSGGALSTPMQPGDTVVVPEKIFTGPGVWRDLLTIAQFATSLAVAAKVLTQ